MSEVSHLVFKVWLMKHNIDSFQEEIEQIKKQTPSRPTLEQV